MELRSNGQSLHFTGSRSTVVSTALAESVGVVAEEKDMIYRISGVGGTEFAYSKTADSVKNRDMRTEGFALEIGAMNYGFDLDGIIELDLLQQLKAVINIDELSLQS